MPQGLPAVPAKVLRTFRPTEKQLRALDRAHSAGKANGSLQRLADIAALQRDLNNGSLS